MRRLATLLVAGSLVALPAFGWQSVTKTKTNPAGSHTMTISKSGKTVTRTMTNTEGNKVLTSSRTRSGKTMTSSRTLIHAKGIKSKRVKKSVVKVKRH